MSNQTQTAVDNLETLAALQTAEALERTVVVTRKITAKDETGAEILVSKEDAVFIRPLVFTQWLKGLKSLQTVISALPEGEYNLSDPAHLALYIFHIVSEAETEVLALAAMATNRPQSFFDELELDEAIKILMVVVEVNKDFFTQKLMPLLKTLAPGIYEQIQEMMSATGQIPSAS